MSNKIKFGFAYKNINPTMPISLAGYFNKRMWEKILDDLEVRALVFNQGETFSAIIQFDLVTVSQEIAEKLYEKLAAIPEISPENLILTATHSHTAPEVRSTKPGSHPDYVPFVVEKAFESLQEALGNMQTGEIFYGMAFDARFAFNRRYWMKDGSVVTNPGKLNPDIMRPEGEIDYEIPIIVIKSGDAIKCVIANIVNHTDTIGGNNVSADWPGFFRRELQKSTGSNTMILPLIGTSGNINHFDVTSNSNQTCYQESERIGCGYAQTVAESLKDLKPAGNSNLICRNIVVETPAREVPEEELKEALSILERFKDVPDPGEGKDITSEDLAQKTPIALKYFAKNLCIVAENKAVLKFNLVVIALGNCLVASLPSEPFVEIGLRVKKEIFAGYHALAVSHSNGTGESSIPGGYIPNAWNYGRGGYETTPRSNPFSVKTAEMLLDSLDSLRKQLV